MTNEFIVEFGISPDSREVIYSVGVDSSRIWKVRIDGGQPVQLTDKHSRNPVFSPDRKQFACNLWNKPNSSPKIAFFPATGGNPIKTYPVDGTRGFGWMPDANSFAYIARQDGVNNLRTQPLEPSGTPQQLTNFTGEDLRSFAFSPDGKQIAVTRATETSDVVLISGFRR